MAEAARLGANPGGARLQFVFAADVGALFVTPLVADADRQPVDLGVEVGQLGAVLMHGADILVHDGAVMVRKTFHVTFDCVPLVS